MFKSDNQRKLFYAVANSKKVANKVNMKQDMARKFIEDANNDKPKKPKFNKLESMFNKKV
jgi:hypothetical protein